MNLLPKLAVITWLTASKKKNLDTMKVLTSMTKLAAMTASRQMILSTRIVFRMTYPGPARDFLKLKKAIMSDSSGLTKRLKCIIGRSLKMDTVSTRLITARQQSSWSQVRRRIESRYRRSRVLGDGRSEIGERRKKKRYDGAAPWAA